MGVALGVLALACVIGATTWVAISTSEVDRRATVIGVATAAVSAVVMLTWFNSAIGLDSRDETVIVGLAEWLSLPVIAAAISWLVARVRRKATAVAAGFAVTAMVLLLNPFTETILACTFGKSIYLTQMVETFICG
jgi:multisubunit Na+/H+ antiporter MnhE subunit